MFKRTWEFIKNNPIIATYYFVCTVVIGVVAFLLMPKTLDFTDSATARVVALAALGRMLLISLLTTALGLVFFSGFGNILRNLHEGGSASFDDFVEGIKKYFVKSLLALLLLLVFYIGLTIVLSIIAAIPSLLLGPSAELIFMTTLNFIALALTMPLVLLWLPAIIIDDKGVIEGLKSGFSLGTKNYVVLAIISAIWMAPSSIYQILQSFNTNPYSQKVMDIGAMLFTSGYITMMVINLVVSLFAIVSVFILYFDNRTVSGENVEGRVVESNVVVEEVPEQKNVEEIEPAEENKAEENQEKPSQE